MFYNEGIIINRLVVLLNEYFAELIQLAKTSDDAKYKVAHIRRMNATAKKLYPDDNVMYIATFAHDLIGRVEQMKLLQQLGVGVFDDSIVDHHLMSEPVFRKYMRRKDDMSLAPDGYKSEVLDICRAVCMFHGPNIIVPPTIEQNKLIMQYINAVSEIDDLDNGCCGAIEYIAHEIDTDAKAGMLGGTYEERMSGKVSPEVMRFFVELKFFDKFKYCKTYADYLVFAMVIGLQHLKDDKRGLVFDLMNTPNENGCTAIQEYESLIDRYVSGEYYYDLTRVLYQAEMRRA